MKHVLSLIAVFLLSVVSMAADRPMVSTADAPVWYYIQFVSQSGVMEAPASDGEIKTAFGNGRDTQLWRLEGTEAEGYTLYSRSGKQMYVTSPEKNVGFFSAAKSPAANTAFDVVTSTVSGSAGFLLAPHGCQVYANQWQGAGIGKRLGLWTADAGCVLLFVNEADFDLTYQGAPSPANEVSVAGLTTAPTEPLTLWYKAPAKNWTTEALPIGNGDMGAMIFGGVAMDRIQFNHKTFWRGGSGANDLGTYLNFGELYVINHNARAVTRYQRRLDIHDAIAQVEYQDQQSGYQREYLASYPDGVIAVRYAATDGQPLDLEFQLINTYGKRAKYTAQGAAYDGQVNNGLNYRAEMRIVPTGGTVRSDRDAVYVSGASEVVIYLTCGTDYSTTSNTHMTGDMQALVGQQQATLDQAAELGYQEIRTRHIADYHTLFDRVDFQLAGATNRYVTGDLLQKTGLPSAMKMVDMLVFQYGRYLTIASSRGVDLPSNLQGIWCQDGTATTGATWASDIHTNINVQMNYWPAESTNLSECHMPLLNFVRHEALRSGGGWQRNARDLGVKRGWVVNTASNIFGGSSSYKVGKYSCANAWLCSHLWQHFAYTRDREYLRDEAFPVMKSACEFWFDRLVEAKDGTLECPNEYSPEQGYVQNATAHSQQLVTQLFLDTQAALEELGEEADCDASFSRTLADKLARLDRGLRVDAKGLLREWKYQENTPNLNADQNYFADDENNVWKGHRHTSHLMALYPHFEIDPGRDRTIFDAAVASLADRGDKATGWARAWRISLWARSRDAKHTYTTLRGFSHRTTNTSYDWAGGLYDNLLDAHATSVFQIEGNFGATAGIAEMLLQSRPDSLVLMPALPTQWAEGHMHGLRAIGAHEIDLDWSDGRLSQIGILSLAGQPVTLAYPGIHQATVISDSGEVIQTVGEVTDRLTLTTEAGKRYVIRWPQETAILAPSVSHASETPSYTLSGYQARTADKGVVIVNRRKMLRR